jgi:hypothetical protein
MALARKAETPALAGQIADARAAEALPRKRVAELAAAFDQALRSGDYGEAQQVQAGLKPAREALALCEGTTAGLVHLQETIAQQEAEESRSVGQAQQRAEGERIVADATTAEKAASEAVDGCLAEMWNHITAAQDAFRAAQAQERKILGERQRELQGRVMAGWMDAMPGRVHGPSPASALEGSTPFIRDLMKFRGPDLPRAPVTFVAEAGAPAGATQASPW